MSAMVFHLPEGDRRLAVTAGLVGNVMEWYDFALYGYMALYLSGLFFPAGSHAASLLATYGVFAAGFLMRPIGSAFFGWLGDTIGRSKTMLFSVAMMAIPTVALGLLPTYEQAGLTATVLLVVIRLVQGLSVGGEFSSSVTYLVETAPEGLRGLSGSWANVGSLIGMLLGSGMAATVTSLFSADAVHEWAWRVPFLFGGAMGSVAIYLRRHLPKSEAFSQHVKEHGRCSPLKEAFTANRKQMVQGTIFASAYGALFYLALVYLPTWLSEYSGLRTDVALRLNTLATALLIPAIPLAGWLSDRFIRRTHLLVLAIAAIGVLALPLHLWMQSGDVWAAAVTQVVFAVCIAFPCGVGPAMFVELFPTRDRLSGYSVTFNVGMGVVGGSTPAVVTWLISKTGYSLVPGLYMAGAAMIAIAALMWITDRSREPLS
jgi:MHS family proline/betaine transporter-like MFS transporter